MKALYLGLLSLTGAAWASQSEAASSAPSNGVCDLTYVVKSNDTCISICSQNSVTYSQLLAWNPELKPSCSNLASFVDDSICLSNPRGQFSIVGNTGSLPTATTAAPIPSPTLNQTTSQCGQFYLTSAGDDCSVFTTKFGISLKDFLFLNQEVWSNCTNLEVGIFYCIQPIGSISTYPGYGGPTPTPVPFNQTQMVDLPYNGNPLDNWPTPAFIIPLANDTRKDCVDYYWRTNDSIADPSCWHVAELYMITAEELVLWNPSLGQGQDDPSLSPFNLRLAAEIASPSTSSADSSYPYTYSCTMSPSVSYCVQLASRTIDYANPYGTPTALPSPRATDEIATCRNWYQPTMAAGDTCQSIIEDYGLTMDQFTTMNPSIGNDCSGLSFGEYYCISTEVDGGPPGNTDTGDDDGSVPSTPTPTMPTGTGIPTPSPVQTGVTSQCNKFYEVQKGDGCFDIAQANGVALDDFYSWNPAVKTDCSGLQADVYVCVGIAGMTTSTTGTPTKTTAKPTGVVTPTPTQTGMVSNCNKFYEVQAGDGCFNIAQANGIPLDSFYAWNPAVKTDCTGLQADVYVCVGTTTSTPTPTKTTAQPTGVVTPTPTQTGMVSNCNKFYEVKSGDGCAAIASNEGIPLSTFYSWNPAVKTDCTGLQANVYVCVGVSSSSPAAATPTPVQSGMVSNCNKFYDVHSGDGCAAIASNEGIPLASFYSWNPAVKTDCSGLQANVYVCVGVSSSAPVATPTPIQSGMVSNCNRFYDVQSGDGCFDIANKEGIDLTSLYQWNPAVKTDCTGLQANVYICIGVAA